MKMRAVSDGYINDSYVKAGQEFNCRDGLDIPWAVPVSKLGPPPEEPVATKGDGEGAAPPRASTDKKDRKS